MQTTWLASPPRLQSDSDLPSWYTEFQEKSWSDFESTALPTRNDQSWRFADLKKMRFEGIQEASSIDDATRQKVLDRAFFNRPEKYAAHYVFANNQLIHSEVVDIPEGAVCLPIQDAIAQHSDLLQQHFMRKEEQCLGGAKFRSLHGAASLSGVFVHAPKGVDFSAPVVVHHFGSGELTPIFPHTLIVAEDGGQACVIENFESATPDDSVLSIANVDLDATGGSHIQYIGVQDLAHNGAKQVQLNNTRVGKNSQVKCFFINLGAAWVRNESLNRMMAEGSDSQIYGASLATDIQEYDQRTLQCHEAQHTTSNLLFKNALYDEARTIFGGLIQVLPGAHHTDSYQTCRNLLGSDRAEANAMPGLEIDADQVKCSHGSTSGQISDEEIFYLQARGIDAEKARRMISFGFLNEVIQNVSGEGLRDFFSAKIDRKFRELG